MRLKKEQKIQLSKFFRQAYNMSGLERMLREQCDKDLEDIVFGDNFIEVVAVLITAAEREQWLPLLIDGARRERPDNPLITQLAAELAADFSISEDNLVEFSHFQVFFLRKGGRFPFVNRTALRQSLESLTDPMGERILVVDGPPGSGKTYTHSFIHYLSIALGSFNVYYFDFKDEFFPGFGPLDLVTSIANNLAIPRDSIPAQAAQHQRWIRELCDWLIGQANVAGAEWWLIFDGVGQIDLTPELYEFIERLAKQIFRTSSPLRLVLLGYGRSEMLPMDIQMGVRQEQINRLDQRDLARFFSRRFASKGVAVNDEVVNAIAEWTMARLTHLSPDRSKQLYHLQSVLAEAESNLPSIQEISS